MPSFTQAEIDTFRDAMLARKGAVSITVDGEAVTFASLEAQQSFLAFMERNLVTSTTPRTRYAVVSKGV